MSQFSWIWIWRPSKLFSCFLLQRIFGIGDKSSLGTAVFSVRLGVNPGSTSCKCTPWEALGDDSKSWFPTILLGDLDWVFGLLPSAWPSPVCLWAFGKWIKNWEHALSLFLLFEWQMKISRCSNFKSSSVFDHWNTLEGKSCYWLYPSTYENFWFMRSLECLWKMYVLFKNYDVFHKFFNIVNVSFNPNSL